MPTVHLLRVRRGARSWGGRPLVQTRQRHVSHQTSSSLTCRRHRVSARAGSSFDLTRADLRGPFRSEVESLGVPAQVRARARRWGTTAAGANLWPLRASDQRGAGAADRRGLLIGVASPSSTTAEIHIKPLPATASTHHSGAGGERRRQGVRAPRKVSTAWTRRFSVSSRGSSSLRKIERTWASTVFGVT